MSSVLWCLVLTWAAAPPVESSAEATTHLYVRTTPAGAQILLDGKELGTSPGVFPVEPGQRRRLVIELDGHVAKEQQITIRDGRITRIELTLTARAPGAPSESPPDEEVERRSVGKKVSDFPETVDLSTPESACAAHHRASGNVDGSAILDLTWGISDPEKRRQFSTMGDPGVMTAGMKAQLEAAEILEVLNYGKELAAVISRLEFPDGEARNIFSLKAFGRVDHEWKLVSQERSASLETATSTFLEKKDRLLQRFRETRAALAAGRAAQVRSRSVDKKISEFPEPVDLSTPESACAAYCRACGRLDAAAVSSLSWGITTDLVEQAWAKAGRKEAAKAQMNLKILRVLSYREDLAAIVASQDSLPDNSRHHYSLRTFGRVENEWKNAGGGGYHPTLEAAVNAFSEDVDRYWQSFRFGLRRATDVQSRFVGKKVSDFPKTADLSTPESACAAFHRASAAMDSDAVLDLCWVTVNPETTMKVTWTRRKADDVAGYNKAQLEAEIVEVLSYGEELAGVVSCLEFPPGVSLHPISLRTFGRIDGKWKNLGEDRCSSLEVAATIFSQSADRHWQRFLNIRDKLVEPQEWKGDVVILRFAVDRESAPDAEPVDIDDLRKAIVRRLDRGWVGETWVRRVGTQQMEVIAFTIDPEQVRRIERLVASPGTIEFRILANERDHKELIDRALKEDDRRVLNPDGTLAGWWVPTASGQEANSKVYPGSAIRTIQEDGGQASEVLVVADPFDVTDDYLVAATAGMDSSGRPCVGFTFDSRGGQLLGGLTAANLPDKSDGFSRRLGIILNGHLHSAPAIRSTIHERGEITGDFTREEVEDLVNVLNIGPLPVPLEKVSEVRKSQ